MSKRLLCILIVTLLSTAGCNLLYKQNVQQGNAMQQEDLDELKLGMTKNQVAFLLGTPSINDPFLADRWDYMQTFSRRGGEATKRLVTLYFENDRLARMKGVEDAYAVDLSEAKDSSEEDGEDVDDSEGDDSGSGDDGAS